MRRAVAWVVALPLAVAATVAAHALDYRLAVPDADARAALLAATGHDYDARIAFLLALVTGVVVVAVAASAAESRARSLRASAWPFLVLPSLVFALQEHVERFTVDGTVPVSTVTEPTFLLGLVLTVPFGLAAWAAARLVLRVARAVALALGRRRVALLTFVVPPVPLATAFVPARVGAAEHAPRGPPSLR
jgi:hypothetical protein